MRDDMFMSLLKRVNMERTTVLGEWDADAAVRRRLANNEAHDRGYRDWFDAYQQLVENGEDNE